MILLFQYQHNRELFDFVGITTKSNNSSVLTQRKQRRRDAEVFTLRKSVRPTFSICYNCFSSLQRAWSGVTTFASSLLPLCAFYDFPMAAFTPADSTNSICILSAICLCPICFTSLPLSVARSAKEDRLSAASPQSLLHQRGSPLVGSHTPRYCGNLLWQPCLTL